jgi:acetyl esterase/lipase
MSLDPQIDRFLRMVAAAAGTASSERTLDAYRRNYSATARLAARRPIEIRTEETVLSTPGVEPITIRFYAKGEERTPEDLLIWFHGGGWVAGDLDTADALCRSLCEASGFAIASVGYRLAPEHPFPCGIEDGAQAVLGCAVSTPLAFAPKRFWAGGESAGAQIALHAARTARDADLQLAGLVLVCPVVDPFGDWPSRRSFREGYFLEESAIQDYLSFLGTIDPDDVRVSPLRSSDWAGFPATTIHTAEYDPVRDEGEALGRALTNSGVPTRLIRHEGMVHQFYMLDGAVPRARDAVAAIGRDLRRQARSEP